MHFLNVHIMHFFECMYACMHACMYVCMYVCMHACMHVSYIDIVYIYIYTHTVAYTFWLQISRGDTRLLTEVFQNTFLQQGFSHLCLSLANSRFFSSGNSIHFVIGGLMSTPHLEFCYQSWG